MPPRQVGLICTGGISGTHVRRFQGLMEALGPVLAPSLAAGRRITNELGRGEAVVDWEALAECPCLVILVPDHEIAATVAALEDRGWSWRGRTVLLLHQRADVELLAPLERRSALTGSACWLPGGTSSRLLVQGRAAAVRRIKTLLGDARYPILQIDAGQRPVFEAGLVLASAMVIPLLSAAQACLTGAGAHPATARAAAVYALDEARRGFLRGGRKAWVGPLAERDFPAMEDLADAVEAQDPQRAEFFRAAMKATARYYLPNGVARAATLFARAAPGSDTIGGE